MLQNNMLNISIALLLIIVLFGLFSTEPQTTGFSTKNTCFDGTSSGKCSPIKPRFCDNGALKSDCQKCSCPADQVCQKDGNCLVKCTDGTVAGQCSENKPLLCYKGSLVLNCIKCGCFPSQTCLNNGSCSGPVETIAKKVAAEEKTIVQEKPEITTEEKEKEEIEKTIIIKKESKKIYPFWNFVCKVFSTDHNKCIDKFR